MKIYLTGAIKGMGTDALGEFEKAEDQLIAAGHNVTSVVDFVSDADNREYPTLVKLARAKAMMKADVVVPLDNYELDVDAKAEVAFARHLEIIVRPLVKVLENSKMFQ